MIRRSKENLCQTMAEVYIMSITSNRMIRDRAMADARRYKYRDLRANVVAVAREASTRIVRDRAKLRALRMDARS